MKSANIVKKLEQKGYKIVYKKWYYWDSVPHVQLDGFEFAIAECTYSKGWLGCTLNFIFNEVQQALQVAKNGNSIILKKIKEAPLNDWCYNRYLILSMEDYYRYKKSQYPFDEYHQVLKRLKNEVE
jgi:hypothetical protein